MIGVVPLVGTTESQLPPEDVVADALILRLLPVPVEAEKPCEGGKLLPWI
jgi:hypothetical protein